MPTGVRRHVVRQGPGTALGAADSEHLCLSNVHLILERPLPRTLKLRLLPLVLLALGACRTAAPTPTALSDVEKAAIQATVDSALRIANAAPLDAAAYVRAYYADDAVYMPPNERMLQGHAAIESWFRALPPVSNVVFTTEEVAGGSGVAYLRGRYTFTVTPPGAAAIVDSGKFLEVWKRRPDGSWRNAIDAFNSDLPLTPPGPPTK